MVEVIEGFPPHVAAFRATGQVTGKDYDKVINPRVLEVYKSGKKMNFFYLIQTPLSNFSSGAWFKDAVLGFVYLTEWKKIAIVSGNEVVKRFTNSFGIFVPGKFRGFMLDQLHEAKIWISE